MRLLKVSFGLVNIRADKTDAVRQYIEYCDAGIIDKGLLQYIVVSWAVRSLEPKADSTV